MPRRRFLTRGRVIASAMGLGVVLLVAIVALTGGFGDVPLRTVPRVADGKRITGSEVQTVVRDARIVETSPGRTYSDDGVEYLVVRATQRDLGEVPLLASYAALRVNAGKALDQLDHADDVILPRDGTRPLKLSPGVPVEVDYVWKLKTGQVPVGTKLVVGVYERRRQYGDAIFGDTLYGPYQPLAQVHIPVASP